MSRRGTDLGDYNAGGKERVLPEDLVEVLKLPKRKWVQVRLVGNVYTYGGYWVKTKAKSGKEVSFFTPAPSYNPETQSRDDDVYDPWRDAAERINTKDNRRITFTRFGWMNVIVRSLQKNAPKRPDKPTKQERKTGFKDKDSDTFTPYRALRMTSGLIGKIQKLQGLNTVTSKKTGRTQNFPVTHERYGMDIMLYYDPDADSPGDMYSVQTAKRTRLTEEEKQYLQWDLTKFEEEMSEDEIRRDFESWAKRNGVKINASVEEDFDDEDMDDDEDGFEEEKPKKRKSKKKVKKSSKKRKSKQEDLDEDDWDSDDEDEDDSDDDWGEEEEEEKPKKKTSKKKSKRKVKEDEDEDDDWDSDDEDEEEEKPKKSKKRKASKKPKVEEVDEDEDDWDSDDEDEDEDDDWDSDDDSDDDWDDEDDDDDDDDDDDWDDEDEDDDDDDDWDD